MSMLTAPVITAFYGGLLGFVAIGIIVAVGRARGANEISIGDGGNRDVIIAMRRHSNFVEFVPLTLLLIGLLEVNGISSTAVHALGGGLLVARVCHAIGYNGAEGTSPLRVIGAVGSMLALAVSSVWAIAVFF